MRPLLAVVGLVTVLAFVLAAPPAHLQASLRAATSPAATSPAAASMAAASRAAASPGAAAAAAASHATAVTQGGQSVPAPSLRGGEPQPQQEEEAALRALLEQYLAAYAAKDLDALVRCWIDNRPDPDVITEAVWRTRKSDVAFSALTLTRLSVEAEAARARVAVSVTVTDLATRKTERKPWLKSFAFRRSGGAWRISREVDAFLDLLTGLERLSSYEERVALLDNEPELVAAPLQEALQRRADALIRGKNAREGLALFELVLEVARRSGGPRAEADALANLALRNRLAGNWTVAIDGYNRALAIYSAAGDTAKMAAMEAGLGGVCYASSDYAAASEHYRKALAGYEAAGDEDALASTWHSLANVAYMEGDGVLALEHYAKSAEIQERRTSSAPEGEKAARLRNLAGVYRAMATVQQELGDYPAAGEAFKASLVRSTLAQDRYGMLSTHEGLGTLHKLQRDYAASLASYLAALGLNEPEAGRAKDLTLEAKLLAEVAAVYALEQRFPAALDQFTRSLSLYEQVKDSQGMAFTLAGMGAVHFAQGAYDAALGPYRRALELHEALHDEGAVALLHVRIGLVRSAQGEHDAALEEIRQGLALLTSSKDRGTRAAVLVLAAGEHASLGEMQEALELTAQAETQATELGLLDVLSQGQLVAGEIHRRRGDLEAATRKVAEAIASRERFLRAETGTSDEASFPDPLPPYVAMVDLLARQGKDREAFDMSEQARVVRFRELLGDGTVVEKGMTPEERANERRLRNQEASLRRQVQRAAAKRPDDKASVRRAQVEQRLSEAVAERQQFDERLRAARPDLPRLRGRDEPARLVDAARVLDARTALLSYTVTESRTYLFAAATGSSSPAAEDGAAKAPRQPAGPVLRVFPIEVTSVDLQQRVLAFRGLILKQALLADSARELYDLLVKPAEDLLKGARRVLIVPDASLWVLPFQALQSSEGRYVIEDRAVAYGVSLTAMLVPSTSPSRAPKRLLSVGAGEPGRNALETLSLVRPDLRFEPLANAETEARAVAAGVAPRSAVLLGREARPARVAAEAAAATTLHLAVPGVLNDASPFHSLLAFPAEGDESGLVDTTAVMALEQQASVVVLSRLQGEPGQGSPGAGVAMMWWAWLVAGTPTTVLSQWVVDRPSTATLMAAFHSRLSQPGAPRSGTAKPGAAKSGVVPPRASEALRLATLRVLAGRSSHPYFWAGLFVVGDGR